MNERTHKIIKECLRILSFSLVLFPAMLRAENGGLEVLSKKLADPLWRSSFEESLRRRTAKDLIPEVSLRLVYRCLESSAVPANPRQAAERVAVFAKFFDEDLRKGYPAATTMAAYRQNWTRYAATAEDNNDGENGEKARASLKAMRARLEKENGGNGLKTMKKIKSDHPDPSGKDGTNGTGGTGSGPGGGGKKD